MAFGPAKLVNERLRWPMRDRKEELSGQRSNSSNLDFFESRGLQQTANLLGRVEGVNSLGKVRSRTRVALLTKTQDESASGLKYPTYLAKIPDRILPKIERMYAKHFIERAVREREA